MLEEFISPHPKKKKKITAAAKSIGKFLLNKELGHCI